MAVAPEMQRRGIGQILVARLLDRSWEADAAAVVLIGHPDFYPRCGFQLAAPLGFTTDFDAPTEAFLVATRPGADEVEGCHIRYARPFYEM